MQVVSPGGRRPAARGHAADGQEEPQARPPDPQVIWGRDEQGDGEEPREPPAEVALEEVDRGGDRSSVGREVGPEEARGGDLEGQVRHVRVRVAGLAVPPAVHHPLGGRDHGLGVARDPLAVKCRLNEPPAAAPGLALARQQAVAQEKAGESERPVLDEVAILCHQDLLDKVGMAEQDGPDGTEPQGDEVAVAAGAVGEETERVAAVLIEVAGEPGAGGATGPVDRRRHSGSPWSG